MIDAQAYERLGFLIVRGVFPASECRQFKDELLREIVKGQLELAHEQQCLDPRCGVSVVTCRMCGCSHFDLPDH